jgi:hypothetical protein
MPLRMNHLGNNNTKLTKKKVGSYELMLCRGNVILLRFVA